MTTSLAKIKAVDAASKTEDFDDALATVQESLSLTGMNAGGFFDDYDRSRWSLMLYSDRYVLLENYVNYELNQEKEA